MGLQIITSHESIDAMPKALFNKHHMLYPKSAWQRAGSDALYLRGEFIVRLPINIHLRLHQEIDTKIGEEYYASLPTRSTFAELATMYEMHQHELTTLSAIDKLVWLDGRLESRFSNSWLRRLIGSQIDFMAKHSEEIP